MNYPKQHLEMAFTTLQSCISVKKKVFECLYKRTIGEADYIKRTVRLFDIPVI